MFLHLVVNGTILISNLVPKPVPCLMIIIYLIVNIELQKQISNIEFER